jgi:hypothetical protein
MSLPRLCNIRGKQKARRSDGLATTCTPFEVQPSRTVLCDELSVLDGFDDHAAYAV